MATQKNSPLKPKSSRTHIGSKSLEPGESAISNSLPEKSRGPLAVLLLFAALVVFFGKVALDSNKVLMAGDNIASEAFVPFLRASEAAGQPNPQWIPHIFGGMPAFAALVVTGERAYDIAHEAFDLVRAIPVAIFPNKEMMTQIWHYFLLGLGMYLFMRVTRRSTHTSAIFAGIAAMFSTWIVTYVLIGHNTKIFAVMTMPYIFMGIEKLREPGSRWTSWVFWSAVIAVAYHLLLESTHAQMVFYISLAVLIYFVTSVIVDAVRKQSIVPTVRAGLFALVMIAMSFGMSADRYMATMAYEPYSIRGAAPIVERSTGKASQSAGVDKSGGLDWEYATAWSFSPQEVITFVVPGWFGFGKMHYEGPEVPGGQSVPTYWGQMNGTDAANYTGIIVLFLGMIAIITLWRKDRIVLPLAITSLVALLLSFGGNFPILFKPMFASFPFFNKFRAPMMALVLMQLSFPILAALALDDVLKTWRTGGAHRDRLEGIYKKAMYVAGALLVLSVVGRGIIAGMLEDGIKSSGKTPAQYEFLRDFAVNTALNDALICSIFALAAMALLYFSLKGKVAPALAGGAIVALTLIDLWRVDYRPMEVTTRDDYAQTFREHDYVNFMKQDKGLFRILDLTNSTSNVPVTWGMQTIAGYHAAKMRNFQDVVDVTGNANGQFIFNPAMWNLLNTKYIIADGALVEDQTRFNPVFQSQESGGRNEQGQSRPIIVWENPQVLPRTFLVNRYEVKEPLEILNTMKAGGYDPRDVVFFDKQPEGLGALHTAAVDSSESATVTDYQNESVTVQSSTSGERLLFMSDSWYPNWKATIDGAETPIYKANYAFRAVKVPAGQHTVKFEYHDPRYETGRTISLTTNILAVLGLAVGIGTVMMKRKKNPIVDEPIITNGHAKVD